jgi:hypothetical protein
VFVPQSWIFTTTFWTHCMHVWSFMDVSNSSTYKHPEPMWMGLATWSLTAQYGSIVLIKSAGAAHVKSLINVTSRRAVHCCFDTRATNRISRHIVSVHCPRGQHPSGYQTLSSNTYEHLSREPTYASSMRHQLHNADREYDAQLQYSRASDKMVTRLQ